MTLGSPFTLRCSPESLLSNNHFEVEVTAAPTPGFMSDLPRSDDVDAVLSSLCLPIISLGFSLG